MRAPSFVLPLNGPYPARTRRLYSVFQSYQDTRRNYDTMSPVEPDRVVCESFQQAARLVAQRWVPQIVWVLLGGALRYSSLRDAIPEISDTLLSERLRELEEAGIVTRSVTPSTPVLIEYGLTDRGRDLAAVIEGLSAWADRWASAPVA
jgi:DNA-binding HxlR family transcriptional regulator